MVSVQGHNEFALAWFLLCMFNDSREFQQFIIIQPEHQLAMYIMHHTWVLNALIMDNLLVYFIL